MLKERLTPTATLLYYWLQNHHFAGQSDARNLALDSVIDLQANLRNFRVWSGEFLEEAISSAEVERSVVRLEELGLVRRQQDVLMLVPVTTKALSVQLKPLPETLWKIWRVEHYLAFGGLAIASAVLLFVSIFVLLQNTAQTATHPAFSDASTQNLPSLLL